jgi:choline-sulfatase
VSKRRRRPPEPAPQRVRPERPARPRAQRLLPIIVGTLAVAAAAVFWVQHRRPGSRPNVLLVTIDTLRADRLGCYGDAAAATPTLDGLAARGVRFVTGLAHVPLTGPSHASILTGLTPLRHGMRDNGRFTLPSAVPTVAEAFRTAGYRTAAFVSGFPLDRRFGLGRGFDLYEDRLPHGNDRRRAPYVERTAEATTRVALQWLQGQPEPWFAWVHYFDPHAPYEPPGELATRFASRPYDGEVAFVDQQLGALLAGIGADARTVVLVTADHGESLGEHGEDTHGVFVYEATLRVPWILAGPGIGPRVSSVTARGIDVAPTLLDYAGLRPPSAVDGRSLRPAAEGKAMADAPAYAESLFARLNLGWAELFAWREGNWKLIEAPRPELFALDTDAAEARNVADGHRDQTDRLRRGLRAALETRPPEAALSGTSEAEERLRSLGYLGGTAPASASRRDPKEGIGLLRRLERGLAEARANPTLAIGELTAVLEEEPRMPLARRYRAIACQAAGKYEAAIEDLRALDRESPLNAEDLVLMAETLRLARRGEEALPFLDRAAQLEPGSPEPPLMKARVLRALGRAEEAAASYAKTLALVPGHIEAERGLAEISIEKGGLAGAAERLERIVAADPDDVEALVKLGVVRVRSGRLEEALALFDKAVRLEPDSAEALLDLAGALAKSGRAGEAVPYFERAIAAGGRTTVALNGLGFARLEAGDRAGALQALRASLALERAQPQVAEVVSRLARGAGS